MIPSTVSAEINHPPASPLRSHPRTSTAPARTNPLHHLQLARSRVERIPGLRFNSVLSNEFDFCCAPRQRPLLKSCRSARPAPETVEANLRDSQQIIVIRPFKILAGLDYSRVVRGLPSPIARHCFYDGMEIVTGPPPSVASRFCATNAARIVHLKRSAHVNHPIWPATTSTDGYDT